MSPAVTRKTVAAVDDSAAAPATVGGDSIESVLDENSLAGEIRKASEQNRATTRGFRQYQKKVIEKAGVPSTHQTRQMASNVCGAVARLPFVPDQEIKLANDETEFDQQVIRTAAQAEEMLGSEMVWTVSARKLARAALELRALDPDGIQGIAWVNDTRADESHVLDD